MPGELLCLALGLASRRSNANWHGAEVYCEEVLGEQLAQAASQVFRSQVHCHLTDWLCLLQQELLCKSADSTSDCVSPHVTEVALPLLAPEKCCSDC
ncbi:hypothetical protein AOLI_G00307210 [Acnodon oligacanthus]